MTLRPRIEVVVLTYNSASELPMCLNSILFQEYVNLRLIVVDNASRQEECLEMEIFFNERIPDGEVHLTVDTLGKNISNIPALFIRNEYNMGHLRYVHCIFPIDYFQSCMQ